MASDTPLNTSAGVNRAYKNSQRGTSSYDSLAGYSGRPDPEAPQERRNQRDHDYAVEAGSQASERDYFPEDRAMDAEAHFLPLHVPTRNMEIRVL